MEAMVRGTDKSLKEKSRSLRIGGWWLEMEELLVSSSAIFDLLKLLDNSLGKKCIMYINVRFCFLGFGEDERER